MVYIRNIKDLSLDRDLKAARTLHRIHYLKAATHCLWITAKQWFFPANLFNVLGKRPELKNPFSNFRGGIWAAGTILTFGVTIPASGQVCHPLPHELSFASMEVFPLGWISPYTNSWFYFGFKPMRTLYYKYLVLLRYKMYKHYKLKQTWLVRSESLLPSKLVFADS